MKQKHLLFGLVGIVLIILASMFIFSRPLKPVSSFEHVHGLAVDAEGKVYIATHHGLLVLTNDEKVYSVGRTEHDFMGFSLHPNEKGVMYASGHPEKGGNLGVIKSENGGKTWKKISDAVRGPADFHAMTISPANPSVLYGWYALMIQRSVDGGKTWNIRKMGMPPMLSMVASSQDAETVYVASGAAFLISRNGGKDWEIVDSDMQMTALASHARENLLVSYSGKYGVAKSTNDGRAWEKLADWFADEPIEYLAMHPENAAIMYAVTGENNIYKSEDSGAVWNQVVLQ